MADLAADAVARLSSKSGRKSKLPRAPERGIQIAIKNHLMFYGIVCVAVPNAGKRSIVSARLMKAEGMHTGFPDLVVLGKQGRAGFLEVKAADGRLSDAQIDCHAMLRRLGHHIEVVRSQDEAMAAVRAWGWV